MRYSVRPAVARTISVRSWAEMARLFDSLIEWLMRARVRRVRRWSFVFTIPVALIVGYVFGVQQGALVLAARAVLWGAVAVAAWRLGGQRGEALRDLLMHPRGRAFARAELDILTALPRLLLARVARREQAGATYHRGTFGLALGLAFTPVVVAEAGVFHLLMHGSFIAWVLTALHGYALIWIWGFTLGPRAFPHRIGARTAVLRNGPMYRVHVPLTTITSVVTRTQRIGGGVAMAEREGAVLLAARGHVDVWLELAEPVRVQRPLREALATRHLAIASDEPERLVALLLAGAQACAAGGIRADQLGLGMISPLEVGGLARDAVQPA